MSIQASAVRLSTRSGADTWGEKREELEVFWQTPVFLNPVSSLMVINNAITVEYLGGGETDIPDDFSPLVQKQPAHFYRIFISVSWPSVGAETIYAQLLKHAGAVVRVMTWSNYSTSRVDMLAEIFGERSHANSG